MRGTTPTVPDLAGAGAGVLAIATGKLTPSYNAGFEDSK